MRINERYAMNVIAQFTVIPIGAGTSLSGYVAACERVLAASGLTYELHANGTNLEGEWEAVMDAIKPAPSKPASGWGSAALPARPRSQ